MLITQAFPSKYLASSDLQGKAILVTMSHVTMEQVGSSQRAILHLQGKNKGMVLNKTNANKIAEIFGDDTNEWSGQSIVLYEAMVDFKGQTVPAIRVRMAPRKQPAPPPQPAASEILDDEIPF